MSLHQKDSGTRVTLAGIGTVTDDVADADPYLQVLEDLVERTEFSGGSDATAATGDDKVQLAFRAGQVVRTSEITDKLTAASVDALDPVTGAAAGGTAVEATGEGLDGVTGVTLGGTACTSVVVVDPRTVTFVTPAKTAGTYNVVFTDDSGTVTLTAAFTTA